MVKFVVVFAFKVSQIERVCYISEQAWLFGHHHNKGGGKDELELLQTTKGKVKTLYL